MGTCTQNGFGTHIGQILFNDFIAFAHSNPGGLFEGETSEVYAPHTIEQLAASAVSRSASESAGIVDVIALPRALADSARHLKATMSGSDLWSALSGLAATTPGAVTSSSDAKQAFNNHRFELKSRTESTIASDLEGFVSQVGTDFADLDQDLLNRVWNSQARDLSRRFGWLIVRSAISDLAGAASGTGIGWMLDVVARRLSDGTLRVTTSNAVTPSRRAKRKVAWTDAAAALRPMVGARPALRPKVSAQWAKDFEGRHAFVRYVTRVTGLFSASDMAALNQVADRWDDRIRSGESPLAALNDMRTEVTETLEPYVRTLRQMAATYGKTVEAWAAEGLFTHDADQAPTSERRRSSRQAAGVGSALPVESFVELRVPAFGMGGSGLRVILRAERVHSDGTAVKVVPMTFMTPPTVIPDRGPVVDASPAADRFLQAVCAATGVFAQ